MLGGGAPLSDVTGIAVGASGTIYVSEQGPGTAGLYSLAAPGFAVTPFAMFAMGVFPWDVKVSGSTLFMSGSDGVVSIDANSPFTQKVVSPSVVHRDKNPTGNPSFIVLSGSTVYGVYASECWDINNGNDSYVVRIDAATGSRSSVANLGCATPGGLAVAPDGSLLIALGPVDPTPAKIIRIDPAGGSTTTVSTGGLLRNPADVALTASGDLVVADRTSGVLRISTRTGKQSTIASGGDLNGVDNVALDASGAIYATAKGGRAAVLTASMPRSQRYSTSGILASARVARAAASATPWSPSAAKAPRARSTVSARSGNCA